MINQRKKQHTISVFAVRTTIRNYRCYGELLFTYVGIIIKFAFRFHADAFTLTYFPMRKGHVYNSHVNLSPHEKHKSHITIYHPVSAYLLSPVFDMEF